MTIILYKNVSDPKAVTKTIGDEITITGVAKDPVNITDPIIEYDGDNTVTSGYNYAFIQDYNRYYFISPQNDSYNLNTLVMHCDVLMSAALYLRQRMATITRNEYLYNAYLTDPDFPAYAYTNIVTKTFPSGIDSDSIILMTVG